MELNQITLRIAIDILIEKGFINVLNVLTDGEMDKVLRETNKKLSNVVNESEGNVKDTIQLQNNIEKKSLLGQKDL